MKIFLLVWAICLPLTGWAFDKSDAVKITPLLKTTQSWDGKPIEYPSGEAQITGLIVEIPVGGETGWHEHPVPSFGVILQGTLEITQQNGQRKRVQAGDGLAEVVNTVHNGKNVGDVPVKIAVFYTGTTDTVLTIAHPELNVK